MVKVFISYAHEDEAYKDQLEIRLKPFQYNGIIDSWTDREILPGDIWDDEIKRKIEESEILLFLISPDFIASDYINKIEIKNALERFKKREVIIIPIIIRPTDISSMEISSFQAIPKDGRPISTWDNQDEAWLDVSNQLRKVIESVNSGVARLKKPSGNSKIGYQDNWPSESTTNSKLQLEKMVKEHKLGDAFDLLLKLTKESKDSDLYNTALLLTSRFNKLKNDELHGIVSSSNANVGRAQLTYGLLSVIKDI